MKYFPYFFWGIILATVAYFGVSAVKSLVYERGIEADRKSTKLETIYLPRAKGSYANPDFQIKLQLERRYLSQLGWRWDAPKLSQVNFALNIDSLEPTYLSPVEDDNVAIVMLSVVLSTAIAASYDKNLPVYSPSLQAMYPDNGITKYGLNYRANEPTTYDAVNENYVTVEKPYDLQIHCKDNGNPYPDLCYLDAIGPNGGGVFRKSKYSIMTNIWFPKERISEWKMIKNQVDKFLNDKITIVPFKESRERK